MSLTNFFLFYLCFLATCGIIVKIFQLWKEGKFNKRFKYKDLVG